MIWKKKTFYLNKILLYILRYDRNQNMSEESQKEIQSTVIFSRTRLRKLTILRKESEFLIFHQKIDQTIKKEGTKVDNKKLH